MRPELNTAVGCSSFEVGVLSDIALGCLHGRSAAIVLATASLEDTHCRGNYIAINRDSTGELGKDWIATLKHAAGDRSVSRCHSACNATLVLQRWKQGQRNLR